MHSSSLTFLIEAGRALNRTLDLPTIYTSLYQAVTQVMACDRLIVSRFDPLTSLVHCEYFRNELGELDVSQTPPLPLGAEGQGVLSQAIYSGQSLFLSDYEMVCRTARTRYPLSPEGELVDTLAEDAGRARSALITPLIFEQQVVGAIQVQSCRRKAHTRRHLRLLEGLALHVAPAMTNAYLYQRAQAELAERRLTDEALRLDESRLESLFHLSQLSFESEFALIDYALGEAVRLTGSQIGYLHFVNPDQASLELFAWSSEVARTCKITPNLHYPITSAGIWADCVRLRAPVIHNDYPTHPGRRGLPDGHSPVDRHMSVPVLDQGRVVVVAGVANKLTPYDEADVRQLQLFAEGLWSLVVRRRAEAALREMLAEKQALLGEVHHRVKNNLQSIISLIGLRMNQVTDLETRSFLAGMQQQARTMALVYDQFEQSTNLAQVEMTAYLGQIAHHLLERAALGVRPAIEIQALSAAGPAQPLLMDIGAAMPCGLLVNELLTNAIRYAFSPAIAAPRVQVLLEERPDEYFLRVADNGVGLPPGFDPQTNGSLGLHLVHLWATHQLGGRLKISSNAGACFEIVFPREA